MLLQAQAKLNNNIPWQGAIKTEQSRWCIALKRWHNCMQKGNLMKG